jgi:hypothetical protein
VDVRTNPAPDEAAHFVTTTLSDGALVTIFGRCTVEYSGRAASELGAGDRLVVIKPDGTTLVHTDAGQQPVNWQPPGCTHDVAVVDDQVHLDSTRSNPDETLTVRFETIAQLTAAYGTDEKALSVTGTEADLRDRILANPSLLEEGFQPLATERRTAAGAIDVYGEDEVGTTVAVELKRRRVGPDAVGQLDRYVTALGRELHADVDVRGILVAPSITDRARHLLAERGLEFVALSPDPADD